MEQNTVKSGLAEEIKRTILTAWQEGHGGSPKQVHLMQSDDSLALLIPEALYQAEIELSRNPAGGTRVLTQYLRTLVSTVSDQMVPLIEKFSGQQVAEIVPLIDLRAGWIISLFRYKK